MWKNSCHFSRWQLLEMCVVLRLNIFLGVLNFGVKVNYFKKIVYVKNMTICTAITLLVGTFK